MRKIITLTMALFATAQYAIAQSPRMNIVEEFTSAHCGPCALYNPPFMALIKANESKVFVMKYQHNIPGPDTMYLQNPTEVDNRATYYSIMGNPNGKANGQQLVPSPPYPANQVNSIGHYKQAHVDTLPATSAFEITIQATLNAAKDSITATVGIKCTKAFTGTTMKLRAALLETLEFSTAPGGNGEKKFENVMRKMYPDANGTTVNNTWTVGQTQSITLKGKVPDYVNKTSPSLRFVVFVQDDANKKIEQAGIKSLGATTSIENVVNAQTFELYPNPAEGLLNVSIDAVAKADITYNVTNIVGQQVTENIQATLNKGNNRQSINIASLANGVYILNIISGEGNLQRKFVKE